MSFPRPDEDKVLLNIVWGYFAKLITKEKMIEFLDKMEHTMKKISEEVESSNRKYHIGIVHFEEKEKYLCNPNLPSYKKEKMTKEREKITCDNCLRKIEYPPKIKSDLSDKLQRLKKSIEKIPDDDIY